MTRFAFVHSVLDLDLPILFPAYAESAHRRHHSAEPEQATVY